MVKNVAILVTLIWVAAVGVALTADPMVSQNRELVGLDNMNTWSIVAYDPTTGEMGVAGASCYPGYIDFLASLVPGKGAGATQAYFTFTNRDAVYQGLLDGDSAETIVNDVTGADFNRQYRQYGVLTVDASNSIETSTWTGNQNGFWAGSAENDTIAFTVQGNILVSSAVVDDAYSAFLSESGTLADKMMAGMEAGADSGGDSRCGSQTALAAFIMVAQPDDPPFAPDGSDLNDPNAPTLYLNALESDGGPNPLISLREQYDQWVIENVPPTAVEMNEVVASDSYEWVMLGVTMLLLLTILTLGFKKKRREQ